MKGDKRGPSGGSIPHRILGSLRDALAAASREPPPSEADDGDERTELLTRDRLKDRAADRPEDAGAEGKARSSDRPGDWPGPDPERHAASGPAPAAEARPPAPPAAPEGRSAAEALREAKTPRRQTTEPAAGEPASLAPAAPEPVARDPVAVAREDDAVRTRFVRGKPKVTHDDFHQDPVVGWLVVVGGPGLGAFRPIYEGNNSIGRGPRQRIPIDFGDNMISAEEQAYIRYDSVERSFLLVPNLTKTNVVAVNDIRPTGAVKLEAMDMITMGRTQLAFVPFCGADFDWSELAGIEE
jgi:hypothetical protein